MERQHNLLELRFRYMGSGAVMVLAMLFWTALVRAALGPAGELSELLVRIIFAGGASVLTRYMVGTLMENIKLSILVCLYNEDIKKKYVEACNQTKQKVEE